MVRNTNKNFFYKEQLIFSEDYFFSNVQNTLITNSAEELVAGLVDFQVQVKIVPPIECNWIKWRTENFTNKQVQIPNDL